MFFRTLALSLCLSLACTSPVASSASDEGEIVVRLATESRLLPIYLSAMEGDNPEFSDAYMKKLEEVLRFDLGHNGMTELLPQNGDVDKRLSRQVYGSPLTQRDWPDRQVYYVLRAKMSGRDLSLRVSYLSTGTVKGIDHIALTGSLNEDRRTIHKLADSIHEMLFGSPGVAATRILYTIRKPNPDQRSSQSWLSEVWEADYDGQNARQITHDGSYCVTPTYLPPSPGKSAGSIFYVSYRTGQPKIYSCTLAQGVSRPFTRLRGNQLMPVASPRRDRVAFICDAGGNPDLFVQDFNPEVGTMGKPYQAYACSYATQGSPAFSPDGRRVAFVSNKDGPTRIFVMDVPLPGTRLKDLRPQAITRINRENTAPSWSPDGSKIAYSSRSQGVRQIWVYDFATGREHQLTQGRGNKENPSWAPNSKHIVFNSAEKGVSDLYIVNLHQPVAIKISGGSGEKRFPDWEPRFE